MPQVESYAPGGRSRDERKLGLDVASILSGAWRETSPSSDFVLNLSADQLEAITPLLCHSGVGALAWRKIRNTPLRTTTAGRELLEVYRRFRLSALIHERQIAEVFSLLRGEGVAAVLIKGWAIARRYPDAALRPYGDIDLCVAPAQFAKASEVLKRIESFDGPFVDLHCGFGEVGRVQSPKSKVQSRLGSSRHWTLNLGYWTKSDDWDELWSRSKVVECAGEPVRILSDEDHLRILCLHLLRSGARRPTWLCDVALLVEEVQSPKAKVQSLVRTGSGSDRVGSSTPGSFNWDLCLGSNPVHANWVASAVKLAHQLLGANIENTPFEQLIQSQTQLPRWLVPAVLKQWGRRVQSPGSQVQIQKPAQDSMSRVQAQPAADRLWTLDIGPWTSLYRRWDNPIRATAAVGGQFNNWPRLPYRVAESIVRLRDLPKHLRLLTERKEIRSRRSKITGQKPFSDTRPVTSEL